MPKTKNKVPVEDRIISVAIQCFEKYGYRRTNITDIARAAGIAAGTLYRYFESKEELLTKVVEFSNEQWLDDVREVIECSGSAQEKLAKLAAASIDFFKKRGILSSVLEEDVDMVHAPLLEELRRKLIKTNVELMAKVVQEGIDDGSFRPMNAERAAFVLFMGGQALFAQKYYPYEEILPVFTDITSFGVIANEGQK